MKVGDIVKMKEPASMYGWRQGAGTGHGLVIEGPHRTQYSQRGCTVLWPTGVKDIPEDWIEVISNGNR